MFKHKKIKMLILITLPVALLGGITLAATATGIAGWLLFIAGEFALPALPKGFT